MTPSRGQPDCLESIRGFSLIEMLVVVAIISLLAGLLLPALSRAGRQGRRIACVTNLSQIGLGLAIYRQDHTDRFPDRRDLKQELPGGYRPWKTWPASDPRAGWAAVVLEDTLASGDIWTCPSLAHSPLGQVVQTIQTTRDEPGAVVTAYWLWRFDRAEESIPLDNFWGKTEAHAIEDLRVAANPFIGIPNGPSDVELAVDVYYPRTVSSLPDTIRGRAVHSNGRNRLMLDGHVRFHRDRRTR